MNTQKKVMKLNARIERYNRYIKKVREWIREDKKKIEALDELEVLR